MARKRLRPTIDSLIEALGRLGLSPDAVDLDRLCAHLELPDYGAEVEDARVAGALRAMRAARVFAETGVPAVRKAIPALRAIVTKDHRITWLIRTEIPLLDNGRLDLRLDIAPDPEAAEILARMAARNDPAHRLEALRAAVAQTALQAIRALHKPVDGLRAQILVDLRGVGADAAAYIAHMDRSLRSRVFTYGPKLARALNDTLTPVRRHAKAVAREGSRLRRLRDQVGFGAYIERFHRRPPPQPADPVPHGADQFRQDLRGASAPDGGGDRGLSGAAAAPGAGELRGPARAGPARRHDHRRGGAGRARSDPHRPHHRDRRPDPAHRRGGDRRDPDAVGSRPGLGLEQRPVRRRRPDRDRLRLRRRPVVCPPRRGGGQRIPGGAPLHPQVAAAPAGGGGAPGEGRARRRGRGLLPPGGAREPRDPGGPGPPGGDDLRRPVAGGPPGRGRPLPRGRGRRAGHHRRDRHGAQPRAAQAGRVLGGAQVGRERRAGADPFRDPADRRPGGPLRAPGCRLRGGDRSRRRRADPDRPVGGAPRRRRPTPASTSARISGRSARWPRRCARTASTRCSRTSPGRPSTRARRSSPRPWRRCWRSPARSTGPGCRSRRNSPSRSARSTGATRSPWGCWSAGARRGRAA